MHGQIIVDFRSEDYEKLERDARALSLGSQEAYERTFSILLRTHLHNHGFVFDGGKIRQPWTNREVTLDNGDVVYRYIQGENENERVRRAEAGLPI